MSSEVRLTRAQKWDLARIATAAVVSTVFISVPMFLVRARPATADTRATAPSVTVAQEIAIAEVSEPLATTPVQKPAAAPRPSDAVSVVTSTELAHVTRPALSPPSRTTIQVRPVQVRARAQTPAAPQPQPTTLSRRLARFIAGDGKHGSPKPFPTVGTSGM
jgi:hypothetical protein